MKKEVKEFLKERLEMQKEKFPFCYKELGISVYCDACKKVFKIRKEAHKKQKQNN